MPRRIRIPCDEIRALYAAGQSTTRLARRYRCSPTTIARHLRNCGVELRRARFAPRLLDADELRRRYLVERQPIAAIAAYFGVAVSTIGNYRRRYGIPSRR